MQRRRLLTGLLGMSACVPWPMAGAGGTGTSAAAGTTTAGGTATDAAGAGAATDAAGTRVARAPAASRYPPVLPGGQLVFPRDFGAHPAHRTEWWYVTGWMQAGGRDIGVQVTFFRSRTGHDEANPSRFAPTQLILGHAALAVDGERRLRHAQRAARAGFGLARFSETDTDVAIGDWTLSRDADDRYRTRIAAPDFSFELDFQPLAPPFPQGEDGYSRKGPRPEQASRYYSRAGLRIDGRVRLGDGRPDWLPARGTAWLDHEWSSEILDAQAVGWDWVGLNLHDGSALMAFRIRRRDGGELWSHARWIGAPAPAPAPRFEALREWRSARSGGRYPVAMRLTVGDRRLRLEPMFDDQELDARSSTGTIYWEGAVRVYDDADQEIGRGYLELTGYAGALRL